MLRSELNPEERPGLREGPTSYKTPSNIFEARCGTCRAIRFVDEATLRGICAASEVGLDNPFRCADCEEEYDGPAYEG